MKPRVFTLQSCCPSPGVGKKKNRQANKQTVSSWALLQGLDMQRQPQSMLGDRTTSVQLGQSVCVCVVVGEPGAVGMPNSIPFNHEKVMTSELWLFPYFRKLAQTTGQLRECVDRHLARAPLAWPLCLSGQPSFQVLLFLWSWLTTGAS